MTKIKTYSTLLCISLFGVLAITGCAKKKAVVSGGIEAHPDTVVIKEFEAIEEEPVYEHETINLPSQNGDTTFLINNLHKTTRKQGKEVETYYDAAKIYIDPTPISKHYAQLADFGIAEEKEYFPFSTQKKKLPHELPTQWMPIYQYNKQYYLYAPCEWIIPKYVITDTTLVYYGWMDGIYGFSFDKITKHSNTHYTFEGLKLLADKLNIYIINPERGIAVFEHITEVEGKTNTTYSLMVQAEKMRQFNVIVHECSNKQLPYGFEQPNFEALVKPFKK